MPLIKSDYHISSTVLHNKGSCKNTTEKATYDNINNLCLNISTSHNPKLKLSLNV